jgi:hypothetical protein
MSHTVLVAKPLNHVEMYLANSGYKYAKSYKGGGELRLHRVGVHSQVEYFDKDGKFSHIITSFVNQDEAQTFIDNACEVA